MFLKALTLRGFKSFADKTTLDFEPGVTVVVGPNGSGKSNLVDAVAWVLGAQGARALRGGKMDDVIFAGTADRPALGRAEVSLTIDNSAGLLPIEFSEVTVTRTLFRTGESEYQLNGAPCRLLDIQELLSDTGIGRQQHVIVGQGQLDTVLNARPEDRRAIIEEAAGVLKYRKRREKAERRLEATEANLLRLTDLLREVRRQLRPLERQADAARRHDVLAAEARAIRLHLAGRDVEQLRGRLERRRVQRTELATAEADVRARLRVLDAEVVDAEHALAIPGEDDLADTLLRVEALRERGRGVQALVAERLRGIERELAAVADEGVVESLVADAAALREQLAAVDADFANLAPRRDEVEAAEHRVASLRAELDAEGDEPAASVARAEAEAAHAAAETAWRDAERDARARAERAEALAAEGARLRAELERARADLAGLAAEAAAVDAAERAVAAARAELDAEHAVAPELTPAGRERRAAEQALEAAEAARRGAEAEASRWRARAEALALALDEAHSAAGGDALAGLAGVAGPLVDHVTIEDGADAAVAAALGDALRAVVVGGSAAARAAVERLKAGDAQALLLVADAAAVPAQGVLAPPGTRPLADLVRGDSPALDAALRRLLAPVVLVDGGWQAALDVAVAATGLVAVTRDGDRFGGSAPWRAGRPGPSLVTPATLDEARDQAARAERERDAAEEAVGAARTRLAESRRAEQGLAEAQRARRAEFERARDDAAARRQAFDVRRAGLEERQAMLARRVDETEHDLGAARAVEGADPAHLRAAVDAAAARLASARRDEAAAIDARRARRAELDRLRTASAALRRDFEVRGAGIDERRAVLATRLADVEARLAARPDEEAAARERRARLEGRQVETQRIRDALAAHVARVEDLAARLREERRAQSEAARAASRKLDGLRAQRAAAEKELTEQRERLQRLEVEEAETRLRLETAVEGIRRDFDCEPEAALAATAPEVPDGMTLAGRARELERELRLLGPVNPLALSEYEALLERHEFLQAQLDDVKSSRRELTRVIRAVDAEIVRVFEEAFRDVAAHFEALFATLFPGGSGRVVLTDPGDPLNTGVEIEARPSGKTVRRLSLLSGGERSLTALAYLFAVFRARPSPFYLLDEVEAALDDVNLHRFLDLVHEFRDEAQLVVVSHQKRTMEAADVLYGVSMPPGGSSRVVSQRIRDLALEDA